MFASSPLLPRHAKPTLFQVMHVFIGHARPGVALVVDIERYNGVKPQRWQVQGIPRLQNDFVEAGLGKAVQVGGVCGQVSPGMAPIHLGMSSRRMIEWI